MVTKGPSYQLPHEVIENSESSVWDLAVCEWEIIDCEESENSDAECICGKKHIRYMFTIRNTKNGNTLSPIGSSCIKKFQRPELSDLVGVYEKLFELLDEYAKKGTFKKGDKLLFVAFGGGLTSGAVIINWNKE